jgi:Zn-dependent protease with chaperone function
VPLPISFILGLFCVILADDLYESLPRDPDLARLYPYLGMLALPWFLARFGWRSQRHMPRGSRGRVARRTHRLRVVLTEVLPVPFACWAIVGPGDLPNLLRPWAGQSALIMFMVMSLPLLVMELTAELGRRQAAQAAATRPELVDQPLRGTLIGFLMLPPLLIFASLDVLGLSRELELLVHATGVGLIVGMGLLLLGMAVILPPLSRWVLPVSREVPEDAVKTAGLLGFPAKDVLQLHSDCRLVNAGLVGPLPGFRYLILTDGLLRILDPMSLRGVVAHEVGHARAGHPILLVTVVTLPLLFLQPAIALGLGELSEYLQLALVVLVVLFGLLVIRQLAHRFELEADQLSSEALGGASPCILALLKVGSIFGGTSTKSSFRHPSDEVRIDHLLRCEGDPWFRELFGRRGVLLRRGIFAAVLLGLVANVWSQAHFWSMDRLVVSFYSGQFSATEKILESLPVPLPERDSKFVTKLRAELLAAQTVYPEGGAWEDIRDQLAVTSWKRGALALTQKDSEAARAWLALGVSTQRVPSALQRSLYLYADAAIADDAALTETLRQHIVDNFELPTALSAALRR